MSTHLSHPPSVQPSPSHSFWLRWTVASAIGALPGVLLALVLCYPSSAAILVNLSPVPQPMSAVARIATLLPGLIAGLGVCIGQFRIIRSQLTKEWLPATTLAYSFFWCWSAAIWRSVGLYPTASHVYWIAIALLGILVYLVLPQLLLFGRWRPNFVWEIIPEWLPDDLRAVWYLFPLGASGFIIFVFVGIPLHTLGSVILGNWTLTIPLELVIALAFAVAVQWKVTGSIVAAKVQGKGR